MKRVIGIHKRVKMIPFVESTHNDSRKYAIHGRVKYFFLWNPLSLNLRVNFHNADCICMCSHYFSWQHTHCSICVLKRWSFCTMPDFEMLLENTLAVRCCESGAGLSLFIMVLCGVDSSILRWVRFLCLMWLNLLCCGSCVVVNESE